MLDAGRRAEDVGEEDAGVLVEWRVEGGMRLSSVIEEEEEGVRSRIFFWRGAWQAFLVILCAVPTIIFRIRVDIICSRLYVTRYQHTRISQQHQLQNLPNSDVWRWLIS